MGILNAEGAGGGEKKWIEGGVVNSRVCVLIR